MLSRYIVTGSGASAIAESVEEGVRKGRLRPGERLPTVRALSAALSLSPATVAAAYQELRRRGVVVAQGRLGTRIAHRPPLPTRTAPPLDPRLRNLADGNPDPELLPRLRPAFMRLSPAPHLYGQEQNLPALMALGRRQLEADGILAGSLAVMGGALDGIERVLQAHLRPGDTVAVEDPGYTGVLDLVAVLGLRPQPVALDDLGPEPAALARALRAGARAFILTPRAQNPTGAALDHRRARELRRILDMRPDVLVIEDDHAGPVAGTPVFTVCHPHKLRWAVVRSVSKSLGPDLRVSLLAGDTITVARVEGRQQLGTGWVSHLLQQVVARLGSDPAVERRLRAATRAYTQRRQALVEALARHGIESHGRSGLNVWIPVADEAAVAAGLLAAGWVVRGGEPYRIASPPAIRVTVAALAPADARRFARDLAAVLRPSARLPAA